MFTSDNGYHLGQHRFLGGKQQVYEEDIRVPLIIRGPGVEAGATRDQMAVNIDLAPTMARWGAAKPDRVMDGRSLVPLLTPDGATETWRTDFLVELYRHLPPQQDGEVIKALRTEHEVYVEYQSGPRELYDLRSDPYQLQNVYATTDPSHLAGLSERLTELATSQGRSRQPGDADGDGDVDLEDLNAVRNTFGQTGPGVAGDTDDDRDVDLHDLNAVRNNFGSSPTEILGDTDIDVVALNDSHYRSRDESSVAATPHMQDSGDLRLTPQFAEHDAIFAILTQSERPTAKRSWQR